MLLIPLLPLTLGGCAGFLKGLADGAEGKPAAPPVVTAPGDQPKKDDGYSAGHVIGAAALALILTLGGTLLKANPLGAVVSELAGHLAASVPVDVHTDAIAGLANSNPATVTTTAAGG
jgi:hypothetical protein